MGEANKNLVVLLKDWGRYDPKSNTISLYDNEFLKDKKFFEVLKVNRIWIQLDLFT